jgi:hypothetical protein
LENVSVKELKAELGENRDGSVTTSTSNTTACYGDIAFDIALASLPVKAHIWHKKSFA